MTLAQHEGVIYFPIQAFNTVQGAFEVRTVEVFPRQVEGVRLVFLRGKNEGDEFLFFMLEKRDDGAIAFRSPSEQVFNGKTFPDQQQGMQHPSKNARTERLKIQERAMHSLLKEKNISELFPKNTAVVLRKVANVEHSGHFLP